MTRTVTEIPSLTIVSGGQTGADRAALDWAIARQVPHGGWCPAGRLAEDGLIPDRYQLRETPSVAYPERTRLNVEDSDATLIVSSHPLEGGTLLTVKHAEEVEKPILIVTRENEEDAPKFLRAFIQEHEVSILNVAGPRASGSAEVEGMVTRLFDRAFGF
ncbi:MAG: putative molybdenum carrier protein [Opitutales bacterium]